MSGARPEHEVRLPVGIQLWDAVTFVHWRVPTGVVRPLVPASLELEASQGEVWVALTPFLLRGLRAPLVPPVPVWSTFFEVNLRTYVRAPDGHDGIWFLRVHCARRLVTAAFRLGLGLPYEYRRGHVTTAPGTVAYAGRGFAARVRVGQPAPLDPPMDTLTGRWNAFTLRYGRLWRVPVQHEPWPLHDATLERLSADLPGRLGIPGPSAPRVHYAPRVRTRIGVPRPV